MLKPLKEKPAQMWKTKRQQKINLIEKKQTKKQTNFKKCKDHKENAAGQLCDLKSVVRVEEQVSAADATVDTAQGHEEAEREEVAMVKMSYAII